MAMHLHEYNCTRDADKSGSTGDVGSTNLGTRCVAWCVCMVFWLRQCVTVYILPRLLPFSSPLYQLEPLVCLIVFIDLMPAAQHHSCVQFGDDDVLDWDGKPLRLLL